MSSRPSTPQPITYVKASCHCGLNSFRAGFLTSTLPISNDLCHCSSCRHSSGQMAVYHVSVASLLCEDSDDPFHVEGYDKHCGDGDGDLIAYHTSDDAVRYFCSVCSAHVIFRYLGKPTEDGGREGGYYCVAAGALEKIEGIVQAGYHIWVEDTLDGGMADHLRSIGNVELPRYSRGVGTPELPVGWQSHALPSPTATTSTSSDNQLHFYCHCRSIQFSITRPSPLSALPHAAYPDLLHPHDITHLSKLRNSEDVKWWLYPTGSPNPTRFLAGHCACDYCRLTSGFEIQSWAYVPLDNIVDRDGQPIVLQVEENDDLAALQVAADLSLLDKPKDATDKRMPGLKQYISSPGRYREFCKKCGATVFAWQAGRPDLICISVGLVDQGQNGARAESWLEWCMDRVSFAEKAINVDAIEGLTRGLKATKQEREGTPGRDHQSRPTNLSLKLEEDSREKREFVPVVQGIKA